MEKNIKVYWLVIIVISTAAIYLFLHETEPNDDLVKYFGFAGTIVSIILGVIAIFYSFITNSQSTENLGKLTDAADKVEEAAKVITNVSTAINKKLDVLRDSIESSTKSGGNRVLPKSSLTTDGEPHVDPSANLPDE